MIFLGVDPGFDGALGAVDDRGRAFVLDAPVLTTGRRLKSGRVKPKREYDLDRMVEMLRRFTPSDVGHVGLELVGARPDQGVTSMFSFGQGYGYWEMGIKFAGFKYTSIPPQKWKHAMLEGVGPEKEGSILRAKQLFPHVIFEGVKGGMKDGRAESLLLAEFVRRQFKQGLL